MPNFNVQLRAMLSKNIALHKRYKAGIICEYVFPLLIMGFVALFVYIFTVLFPITTKPYSKKEKKSYLQQTYTLPQHLFFPLFSSLLLPHTSNFLLFTDGTLQFFTTLRAIQQP